MLICNYPLSVDSYFHTCPHQCRGHKFVVLTCILDLSFIIKSILQLPCIYTSLPSIPKSGHFLSDLIADLFFLLLQTENLPSSLPPPPFYFSSLSLPSLINSSFYHSVFHLATFHMLWSSLDRAYIWCPLWSIQAFM